jgi:hypothetical protein
LKEKDLLKWATDVLTRTGWDWWHVPAPMRASRSGSWVGAREAAGLPDIFAIHKDPYRLLIIETKGTGGRLTEKQRHFLELARALAAEVTEADSYGHETWIGVVVLLPGMEDVFEKMCKSKVLL